MSCCINEDGPERFKEEYRRARKQHSCCECGASIKIGEVYQYVSGMWGGMWDTFKTCEKCADLRDSLSEVFCASYEGLSEEYTDYLSYGPNTVMKVRKNSHAATLVPEYFLTDPEE